MQKAKKPIARWAFLLFIGAADRNRTGDLRITNALLYQLSYSGNEGRIIPVWVREGNLLSVFLERAFNVLGTIQRGIEAVDQFAL